MQDLQIGSLTPEVTSDTILTSSPVATTDYGACSKFGVGKYKKQQKECIVSGCICLG